MSGTAVEPSSVETVSPETGEEGLGNEDASFEAGEHGQVTDQGPPPVVRDADISGIESRAPQTVSDRAFSHGKEYVCKVCSARFIQFHQVAMRSTGQWKALECPKPCPKRFAASTRFWF